MKSLEFPAERALVLVCEKCGRRVDDAEAGRTFYKRLRKALKSRFGKGQYRVVETSCMDLCPKNAIAMAICGKNSATHILSIDDPSDVDGVVERLEDLNTNR